MRWPIKELTACIERAEIKARVFTKETPMTVYARIANKYPSVVAELFTMPAHSPCIRSVHASRQPILAYDGT